jgi:hypothetical protein
MKVRIATFRVAAFAERCSQTGLDGRHGHLASGIAARLDCREARCAGAEVQR